VFLLVFATKVGNYKFVFEDLIAVPEAGATQSKPDIGFPRGRLLSGLASALIPGLGQLGLGERTRGSIFLALGAGWILLFFPAFPPAGPLLLIFVSIVRRDSSHLHHIMAGAPLTT
jgi:hypothetical protein